MSFPQDSPPLEDDGDEIIIPINRTFTDGDRSTWPTEPRWGMPEDDYYRRKLAEAWLKETGAYEPGMFVYNSLVGHSSAMRTRVPAVLHASTNVCAP